MATPYFENYDPYVQANGFNTAKDVVLAGTNTLSGATTLSGSNTFSGATTISGAITSTGGASFAQSGATVVTVGSSSTGTDISGSVTVNAQRGVITTAALTTIAGTSYSLVLKNTSIGASSQVFASVYNGTNTGGLPAIATVAPAAAGGGSATILVTNLGTATVLNGTLKVNFFVAS
jgi:fibronectin-binding autotransporter adhesin